MEPELQAQLLEEQRRQGLCSFYIARHRRFCRKRSGTLLHCSDHSPSALNEIRERTFHQQATKHLQPSNLVRKSRRSRISSSQKRMMNPLNVFHSNKLLSWGEEFDHRKELMVDVGCARGTLIHRLAVSFPEYNYCGLEIRPELVHAANEKAFSAHVQSRLRFLGCSANFSFQSLFGRVGYCDSMYCWSTKPCFLHHNCVGLVSILFPDPWKRGRHQRRRVLNSHFVSLLADCLDEGAIVYVCSDVLDLAIEMKAFLAAHPCFSVYESPDPKMRTGIKSLLDVQVEGEWLAYNPLPFGSERDQVCEVLGREVYRAIFQRNHKTRPLLSESQPTGNSNSDSELSSHEGDSEDQELV